ncbi:MAG TPA: hypothetical protein VFW66_12235 [Gemmatimonadales bacterium]|nr:hypothetical protein [Gemmatimonadales bacterium]
MPLTTSAPRAGALTVAIVALLFAPSPLAPRLAAQNEAALRSYFEGHAVALRIDLPATDDGVDVYPGTAQPLDYPEYAKRIKKHGTAIRAGELATVTKLKVKGKLIEFQLGGGGYGTFGDPTDPSVSVSAMPKSQREKDLERDIPKQTDPVLRRRAQEELDALRAERERQDRRNQALTAGATERKREFLEQKRLAAGSRFNLRYRDGVPAEALTSEAVMAALAAYVDFDPSMASAPPPPDPAAGLAAIWKGMSVEQADSLLGAPTGRAERMEGTLRVNTRTYERSDGRVVADFVEGVLVRYAISSP